MEYGIRNGASPYFLFRFLFLRWRMKFILIAGLTLLLLGGIAAFFFAK
jgi:hypothetical protein